MRKLCAEDTEIMLLREKCQVFKNLLRDVMENEAMSRHLRPAMDEAFINRVLRDQFMQRQALCAEIGVLLYQEDHDVITLIS